MQQQTNMKWSTIQQRYSYQDHLQFQNIFSLINLIQTMSPSSAEAERGFSQMKLIKTSLRSRLSQDTLNSLMGIKLLSEPLETFDPLPAIHLWNSPNARAVIRRPNVTATSTNTGKLDEIKSGSGDTENASQNKDDQILNLTLSSDTDSDSDSDIYSDYDEVTVDASMEISKITE